MKQDIVEKFIIRHKELFQKAVAFFCALGILALFVAASFAIPTISASASDDSYSEYLDDAAGLVVEIAESGTISKGSAALLGVQIGLNEAYKTAIRTGRNFSLRNFTGLGGLYWHNSTLHYAWCSIDGSYYNPSDGGFTFFASDEATVRCIMTTSGNPSYNAYAESYAGNNYRAVFNCNTGRYVDVSVSIVDSGGSTMFPEPYEYTKFVDYGSSYYLGCFYGSSNNIPTIYDNSRLADYFNTQSSIGAANLVASWGDSTVNPRIRGEDLPSPDFDFTSNTFEDYILEIYNPWIEENYPDLTIYLYDPDDYQDPTEDTTECTECGGCNCIHNITVNVEPTVNVEVNVENQFPSEWLEEFTLPSGAPVETLPAPTMPTVQETQDMTLPTMDIPFEISDGMHFWSELLTSLVHATDILPVVILVLLLTIAEWVLWHVGR